MSYHPKNTQELEHILVVNTSQEQQIVVLKKDYYSIGRYRKNSIVINSQNISRKHATIIKYTNNNGEVYYSIIDGDLEGKKSKNGIFVNGIKCLEKELKHSDIINFDNQAKACYYIINKTNNGLEKNVFNPEFIDDNLNQEENLKLTITTSYNEFKNHDCAQLLKFASVIESSPYPIVEINFKGELTFLNQAANQKFRDLPELLLKHPILQRLLNEQQHESQKFLIREISIEQQIFEQHIYYLTDEQLIRSYLFDVTQRKQSEETLKHQAFHDSLTGLPNRIFFNEHLSVRQSSPLRIRSGVPRKGPRGRQRKSPQSSQPSIRNVSKNGCQERHRKSEIEIGLPRNWT